MSGQAETQSILLLFRISMPLWLLPVKLIETKSGTPQKGIPLMLAPPAGFEPTTY
jgi:hypothetical protein